MQQFGQKYSDDTFMAAIYFFPLFSILKHIARFICYSIKFQSLTIF